MLIIDKIYERLLRSTSKAEERGEYSQGYWEAKIRQKALDLCSSYLGRLLEVGCGEGLFLLRLRKINPEIELWGVDNWDKLLTRAQALFLENNIRGIRLVRSDAASVPFPSGSFDTVVCINVFLNMAGLLQVKEVIGETARVCKPGGKVIVEFRNSLNPFVLLKFKLARFYDATIRERHLPLNTYGRKEISACLREAGLDVVKEHGLDFPIKRFAPIIILEARKRV